MNGLKIKVDVQEVVKISIVVQDMDSEIAKSYLSAVIEKTKLLYPDKQIIIKPNSKLLGDNSFWKCFKHK